MSKCDRPIANPVVVLRDEFDDWAVLFNPDTGEALGINPAGVAVWKLLDGKLSLEDITAEIRESFAATPENVLEEIRELILALTEKGFVEYEFEVPKE